MVNTWLATAGSIALVLTILNGQLCASNPDSKEVTATWEVYLPLAGCDDGEPVANFEVPVEGGAKPRCDGSPPVDRLLPRPISDQRSRVPLDKSEGCVKDKLLLSVF